MTALSGYKCGDHARTPRRVSVVVRALGILALVGIIGLGLIVSSRLRSPQLSVDAFPMATCSTPGPARGRVFYLDPVRGSPSGDGSRARPWRDLNGIVAAGLIGERRREVWKIDRLLARLLGRPPTVRLEERPGARVRAGDTVLLASGNYGHVDLSGLVNSGFVTIAAEPGAKARFASLNLSSTSHFLLRGITVVAENAAPRRAYIVSLYDPGAARADNIIVDAFEVRSELGVAAAAPAIFAASAPDGIILAGDCVTLKGSRFGDVASAINIYRSRRARIADNVIDGIAIDGIQFSGRDIVIRNNIIVNQWPTPSPLHPDCMQGVEPEQGEMYGPVTITGNLCIRALAGSMTGRKERPDIFGWQGISIFDGQWNDLTLRCNLVFPSAQHGIALYGAHDALISENVVLGITGGRPTWIAALPAKNGRQSSGVVIRSNRASGYLNAVKGAPVSVEAMIDFIKLKRGDATLLSVMRGKVEGVTLAAGNIWLTVDAPLPPFGRDARFSWETGTANFNPNNAAEALRLHPLPVSCAGGSDA